MKIVKRKVNELKINKEQPRKTFNEGDINLLVESIKNFDLINLIEIDENNVVITGELRLKALQKLGTEEVECKLIEGLSDIEKSERQYAENEHRSSLTSEERENFVFKLWNTGKYKTQRELADKIIISRGRVSNILTAKKVRDSLKKTNKVLVTSASTETLSQIAVLPEKGRTGIFRKLSQGEITPSQVRNEVKKVKRQKIVQDEIKAGRLNKRKTAKLEKLNIQQKELEKKIVLLKSVCKKDEQELIVISKEIKKDFPNIDNDDPAYILQYTSEYYDNELSEQFKGLDSKINILKKDYNKKAEPIRKKLNSIEKSYNTEIGKITKEKILKNKKSAKLEKNIDKMLSLFEEIESNEEEIVKLNGKVGEIENDKTKI